MKGQYLTVEYVFFFAIGVAMIIAVYFIFFGMNETMQEDSAELQLIRTSEMMRGTIINVFEDAQASNSTIIYDLDIPTSLSGCVYRITVGENLLLNCTDDLSIGAAQSLYGINITANEILYSTKGFIRIESDGTGVMLS